MRYDNVFYLSLVVGEEDDDGTNDEVDDHDDEVEVSYWCLTPSQPVRLSQGGRFRLRITVVSILELRKKLC